jgi:putative ABC transport system permease protein
MKFGWRSALRIAWREARSSSMKFLFVVLAVAAGVGALTGVRGFSTSFEKMLLDQARTMMAADMSVRIFGGATEEQVKAMDALRPRGVKRTEIVETLSMIAAGGRDPALISVKAIDPTVYPFYGVAKVLPPARLVDLLDANTVVVSDDLSPRMNVKVGDSVKIGAAEYRIGGVLGLEPDKMSGSMNVGPRVLMSRAGLERADLLQFGSRAAHRFLFKLPADSTVESVRVELKKIFPEGLIVDFREINPNIKRALERSTTFLSLVSLIALIVGALGVAMAMQTHLRQKMDTIAIMKCLGARSSQILRIYTLQTLVLGLLGGLLGIVLGLLVQRAFPILIARFFPASPGVGFDLSSAIQGLAVGLCTTMLFTLPSLMSIRHVKPGVIFRRDMAEAKPTWRETVVRWRLSALVSVVILAGVAGIAAWLSESVQVGSWFAGGLLAGLLALSLVAWLLLRALRLFLRFTPWRLPATIRHGMANLYRPGNYAGPVLVALGVGVMFTLSVYLIQHSLLDQIARSVPPSVPNVFLINITSSESGPLQALMKQQKGVGSVQLIPSVAARLLSVDGSSMDKVPQEGFQRRYLRTRSISWSEEQPGSLRVMNGAWWQPGSAEALASVSTEAAKTLNIKVGSTLEWDVAGKHVRVRVAALHVSEQVWNTGNQEFITNRSALEHSPMIFFCGVRVAPSDVAAIQRNVYQKFPTVTVVNAADIMALVQDVIDQVAVVVRFISLFAILAGVVILASSVAGTRFRRIREVVILKTLGATRHRLAGIFSVEFIIIGLTAGVMGSILATAFSSLLLKRLLDAPFEFSWVPNLVSILATAVIANGAGWLASFRILQQKPLEVLRGE